MTESRSRLFGRWFLRALTLASFALWFGGLTFYIAWVVPIGTDVLGSAFAQGMVTRQATGHLNILAAVALLTMLGDNLINRQIVNWRRQTMLYSTIVMLLLLGGLFWMHPQIDSLIDLNERTISDYDLFYLRHRIYLWLTTVQWICAWIWLCAFARAPEKRRRWLTDSGSTP